MSLQQVVKAQEDQNNQMPQEEKALSSDEYHNKYNLEDAEVFKQQGEQLAILEECLTLLAVSHKLTGASDPQEHWKLLRRYQNEGTYFKEWLKTKLETGQVPSKNGIG